VKPIFNRGVPEFNLAATRHRVDIEFI